MPYSPNPPTPQADAVCRDVAQMAAHMRQCADARGHWFGLRNGLQCIGAATAGRLVTAACLSTVLIGMLAAFR